MDKPTGRIVADFLLALTLIALGIALMVWALGHL